MGPSNEEESADEEASVTSSSVRTARHYVDDVEWHERLQAVGVPRAYLNQLVMNFLIREGHQAAAVAFQRESGTAPAVDLASVQVRVDVRDAVVQGKIELALARLRALEPAFLDERTQLLFVLRRQQFVELVREGREMDALAFARDVLRPLAQDHHELLTQVEEALSLLASPPHMLPASPFGHLLDERQRQEMGERVNSEILAMHNKDRTTPDASIESLLQLLVHTQRELETKADFPMVPESDFMTRDL